MPLIDGTWTVLPESDTLQTLPTGVLWPDGTNFLHFCKQWSRDRLASLAATFGWPLRGVFISSSGGPDGIPDWLVHRSEFPLVDIHATPAVTVVGQTGTTTWGYKVVPRDASGLIQGATGAEGRVTNGRATQNASNGNNVAWTAVSGAASYDVFLATGPLTLGKIATTASLTFNHRGQAGDGTSPQTQTQVTAVSKSMDDAATTLFRDASGSRSFWISTHFWNYRADRLYVPRESGAGDYQIQVSDDSPPANWWQWYP